MSVACRAAEDTLTSGRPAMKNIKVRLLEYENFIEIAVRCSLL
jgi:hypothetical protein